MSGQENPSLQDEKFGTRTIKLDHSNCQAGG